MTNVLSDFLVNQKWPTKDASKIQLYTLHTPNGAKVAITLEELGLGYEVHKVMFSAAEQHSPEFLSLSPNGKIPAIIDPDGPNGEPIPIFESAAIMQYLAEKTGMLIPADVSLRWQVIQWLLFQNTSIGPMFGQFGHFHKVMAGKLNDSYALERYSKEVRRLYSVLDVQLSKNEWLAANQYSIADIAVAPWIWTMKDIYKGEDVLGARDFIHVERWYQQITHRPAWQAGLYVAKSSYGYE